MCSDAIVVASVRFQNSGQMCLAQNNDVIQTLAPNRSDQPFGKAVLPGGGRCNESVPDAHGAKSTCDRRTIDTIPVTDHVARSFIPRECFCDLAHNPIRGRMSCEPDPDQLSPIQPHDDVGVEQVEAKGRPSEQMAGVNLRRVVTQEGAPSLAGWP